MRVLGCDMGLLREIAVLFLAECPHRLAELHAALDRRDLQAVERIAHSLKGSMSNFVATQAVAAAAMVEGVAHAGDEVAAVEASAALEREVARVRQALAELC